MPRNAGRLDAWKAHPSSNPDLLTDVRACLDDDLDTPGAFALIDAAAAAGEGILEASDLLGVPLD